MSGPSELAMATGILADAGLKATVVLGLGWAATRLLRKRTAARRHGVWAVVFASLPLLLPLAVWRRSEVAIDAPWVLGVWAVGLLVAWLPLLRGLVHLHALRVAAEPDAADPSLLRTDAVRSPLTWGLWRPVILLPRAADAWPAERRAAALAHERAHVRRRDWAVHLGAWAVCTVFWFHPLVWWARRALTREAEHAADDAVLARGVRPSSYAELLLTMARAPVGVALGVGASDVGQRVHAVLAAHDRSPGRRGTMAAAVVVAALLLPALGVWSPWTTPERALTCQPGLLP